MVARTLLPGLAGLALGLSALAAGGRARGAGALEVAVVASGEGCPGQGWFEAELRQRSLTGLIRVVLGPDPGGEGFVGEITAQAAGSAAVKRRLAGPRCQTVAEGLVLVAQIHLLGLAGAPAASAGAPAASAGTPAASASTPVASAGRPAASAGTPAASASTPAASAGTPVASASTPAASASTPAASARSLPAVAAGAPPAVAIGGFASVDTSFAGSLAVGGGVQAWGSLARDRLRGVGLAVGYGRRTVDAAVPLELQVVRARLDVVGVEVRLDPNTWLGPGAFVSGGVLRAEASLAQSNPGSRWLWVVGVGPRLRRRLGPVLLDLDLGGTLTLTRRTFEVSGLAGPLAELPRFGLAGALAVLVPLGR